MPPDSLLSYPQLATMADIVTDSQPTRANSQGVASHPQEIPDLPATMRHGRRVRATMSPSPAPQATASTPMKDPVTGRLMPELGALSRTPVPAKYSTSYGSPMTQPPDRSTTGAGGNITKAAAEIFTAVKRDNVAAEVRRRAKDEARRARAGSTPSPPASIQPTIEVDEAESEAQSEDQHTSGEEASEYEDQSEDLSEDHLEPQAKKRVVRKSPHKTTQKRPREDEEAEARAEQERKERDARLRRERSAEARNLRKQKMADAKAAREEAERERAAQQAAREEAARAAMPPPPQPPPPRATPEIMVTPATAFMVDGPTVHRPGSARSFVEEGNIFQDAAVETPTQQPPKIARRPGPPPPSVPPPPAQPPAPESAPAAARPPEPASPPSVLKRPPRRPGGTTPASRAALSSGPSQPRAAAQQRAVGREPSPSEDEDQSQQPSPSDQHASSDFASRVRYRLKPLPAPMEAPEKGPKNPPRSGVYEHRAPWPQVKHALTSWASFITPWSILKLVAGAFVLLHLLRLGHVLIRPDLFEPPRLTLRWYGWNDWTSNVGQFFPSPLLHPLGVLTDNQYDDLKDYLQQRTTTTETALDNLKSILPKVVSVRKDKKGRILIAEEFWDALRDRILHDSRLLSLDQKSRISDKHWKAIEQRLKDAGLLTKPLSAGDIEKIVDKAAPVSWERWLEKNKRKVSDILGPGKGSSKGSDEAVVSKDEFIREVNNRLEKSKKEVDREMDSLRKELHSLISDVKKIATAGGMTRADTTKLIKQVLDQEITRRLAGVGNKRGGVGVDAMFRSRVNLFAPGNNAYADTSLCSPTYRVTTPLVGSKEWLKKMPNRPQYLFDAGQALTPWSEPGHCWCAGILGEQNRTNPAQLGVRLPQFVIPQQVILEHIDPASTTDPLAMPRDVEVWAVFDEHGRQERVLNWMAAQYPNDMGSNKKLIDGGWRKIGAFTYEYKPQDDGVYVHQLSRDLVDRLKAATDSVLIRAMTNYGAKDHTCFYRVRLYGDVAEDLEAERESKKW